MGGEKHSRKPSNEPPLTVAAAPLVAWAARDAAAQWLHQTAPVPDGAASAALVHLQLGITTSSSSSCGWSTSPHSNDDSLSGPKDTAFGSPH